MPHFDQYTHYIWWAYGLVGGTLGLAVALTLFAYWRAKRNDG